MRNYQLRPVLAASNLRRVAEVAQAGAGRGTGTIAFAFVHDARMTDHHRRFVGKDATTDVLSFRADDGAVPDTKAVRVGAGDPTYWGDVMICTDQAARQARELGHPYLYELSVLALHGVLHLVGYDHTSDGGTMSRLERALRPRCVSAGTAT